MSKKTPKPKKKHKGLIIFLIIFSILVVFPVGFIFGAFYSTSTKNVSDSEVTYQNIVSKAFYNGVENLSKDDPTLRFTIDEEMFDGILMAACEKIGQPQYIPKMYCYIKDNNYTFVVDLQASFFKSSIQIHTTLNKEGDTLVFKITGITLGRLPIPLNWITSILGNFINDEMLNSAFDKAGFHLKSHLSETKLTYNREDFKTDVAKYVSELGSDNPFLNIMLSMFGDESVLTTEYKDGVGVALNLKRLSLEESPYKDPAPLEFDSTQLDEHKKHIVTWLNNGTLKEENVAQMFTYFIRGYDDGTEIYIDNIDSKLKEEVCAYLQPESGEVANYSGTNTNKGPFKGYCKNTIDCTFEPGITGGTEPPFTINSSFTIDTVDLNPYMAFAMTDAIGKTIPITYFDENDGWKFEYVFVDNMYVGFDNKEAVDNPKMVIYLQFNISNKYDITMTAAANNVAIEGTDPTSTTKKIGNLSLELQDINFGGISINDSELRKYILDLLPTDLEGGLFTYGNDHLHINLDAIAGAALSDLTEIQKTAVLTIIKMNADNLTKSIDGTKLIFGCKGTFPAP